jgi:hypothetical protein
MPVSAKQMAIASLNRFGQLLTWTLGFLYGTTVLAVYSVQMLRMNRRFRSMDELDKKELAAGNMSSLRPSNLYLMNTN